MITIIRLYYWCEIAEASVKDSMMVLVNAMYFKGTWYRQPFAPNATKIDTFRLADGKTTLQVPFMRANGKFYYVYAADLNSKILRIPYSVGLTYQLMMR